MERHDTATRPGLGTRLAAWSVHAYTAIGVVLALLVVHHSYAKNISVVLC